MKPQQGTGGDAVPARLSAALGVMKTVLRIASYLLVLSVGLGAGYYLGLRAGG